MSEAQQVPSRRESVFGMDSTLYEVDGATYIVPDKFANHAYSKRIREGKYYEPKLHKFVAKHLKKNPGSMVHAGTFIGDMLPRFSAAATTLYAFEPEIENYLAAKAMVDVNNLANVFLINAALGAQQDVLELIIEANGRHLGGRVQLQRDELALSDKEKEEISRKSYVPVVVIDHLKIEDLSLLQLDVEGYELQVLQGATQTLEKCKPAVVVEDKSHACAEYLREFGYELTDGNINGNALYTYAGAT